MTTQPPAPDSPEAHRAARKVRSVFFGIAIANIVLFAIVLWHRHTTNDEPGIRVEEMEAVASRTLAAYNSQDEAAFLSSFSAKSSPRADHAFFATTIRGFHELEIGRVIESTLFPSMTESRLDGGTLVYDIRCEKQPQARLTVKFVRESDAVKLIEWRIENRP